MKDFAAGRLAVLLLLVAVPGAAGQPVVPRLAPVQPPTPAATTAQAEDVAVPDSPRASLRRYLELTRAGRDDEAAKYLDIPPERAADAAPLARRLRAVLGRYVWIDLSKVSREPEGSGKGGLPQGVEEIGTITDENGATEPVRLVRRKLPEGTRWIFSRRTVSKIDEWYAELPGRWLLESLPAPLLRFGPRHILWGQWIVLILLVFIAVLLGGLLGWIFERAVRPIVRRAKALSEAELNDRLRGPFRFFCTLVVFEALLPHVGLYERGEAFVDVLVKAAGAVLLFWVLLRLVDVVHAAVNRSAFATGRPSFRAMMPVGSRVTKLFLGALGAVAAVSALGYPVASLLAGLGIGGVILALAAQKTVENLFGSLSIGADRPFGEGDTIAVEGLQGKVEKIGLRSTRIRTDDRTIVTFPNGKLADSRIETFSVRDRLRFTTTLSLVYGTTADQIGAVLSGIETLLTNHPKIWPGNLVVRFKELGASSLNIEVTAWFQTSDGNELLLIRQELLLEIMKIVEKAGTSFAFPTQTIYLGNAGHDAPKG